MNIGNFEIGAGKTFIIAECCSNIIPHLYNLGGVVSAVASTGANALKVQLYLAEHFGKAEQESKRRTEFPRDLFPRLVKLCHEKGFACGASVFDEEAVNVVVRGGGDFLKFATSEIGNRILCEKCRKYNLPMIASYDYCKSRIIRIYSGKEILLACVPEYPSSNFRIPRCLTGTIWGWSSHTNHWLDCLIAVSRGAVVVEKHITFSANDYETGWSLYPNEFQQMVKDIRWVEEAR